MASNILDLNDYCLVHILKYLELEDRVRFAQASLRFREVLRDWTSVLYPEFEIERSNETDAATVKWQFELLCILSDVIKGLYLDIRQVDGKVPLDECFSIDHLCKQISLMENLESFAINEGSMFGRLTLNGNAQGNQFIEMALGALEFLPNIRTVSVSCRTEKYKASSLIQMKCLQRISIDTKIASEDLVEICKSNANLRVLWLREVVGELADIVAHCPNLVEIAFPIFSSHKSYAPLSDLPKLRKITIKGTTTTSPCSKTIELLNSFAAKREFTKLESLILYSNLNFEEASNLVQLSFLKELRCSFDDGKCIDLLTDLVGLESLYIMMGRSSEGSKECLNVLRSCTKLEKLHINSNLSTDFVEKAVTVLRTVRNTKKQKPLELYSSGVMHLCTDDNEKLIDNAYCSLVNHSEYLRALPWKFPN